VGKTLICLQRPERETGGREREGCWGVRERERKREIKRKRERIA
jgi:hypothetical protein